MYRSRAFALIIIIGTLCVSGCVTNRAEKPILTAVASSRIAAKCGAVRSEFHRQTQDLPYAVFITKNDEIVPQDGPSVTVRCISTELEAYQHSMLSFRTDETVGN